MNVRNITSGIVLLVALTVAGCQGSKTGSTEDGPYVPLEKLEIEDTKPGTGAKEVKNGDIVAVAYTGWFATGVEFDSNRTGGKPLFTFQVGEPGVIDGWNQGIVGMKEKGVRRLSVPYKLAYGEKGRANIGPKADLYFELELAHHFPSEELQKLKFEEVKVGTGPAVKKGDKVAINYVITRLEGQQIDSSEGRGPQSFTAGDETEVLIGIARAVIGMQVGGRRRMVLPPDLAFGNGFNGVPRMTPVIVEMELVKIG